jgi:Rrf2 family protein
MNKDQRLSSAIHILIALDYVGGFLNSQKLAVSLQTNPGFIRRILSQLSKAGLVVSEKRKGGGSKLAQDTAKITIGDIYLALGHNRIFKSFEKKPFEKCRISCCIKSSLDSVYEDIEGAMLKRMKKITLKEVINKMK